MLNRCALLFQQITAEGVQGGQVGEVGGTW